ncbi:MAG TPA: hypothetical protein ENJ20_08095 [Bacteroidetes bacterium]|nr:hypothetical protein [Bacteroidota bacterium]
MMPNNLTSTFFASLIFLLISSCTNLNKMIEEGNYDEAISVSTGKLAGKKKKKEKYVKALETAFRKATNRDMRRAKTLATEGLSANWGKITRIYERIQKRQEMIEPLLPLLDKDGYKADFQFVRVDGLLREAKEKAAGYYYREGKRLMKLAESGNKQAARDAWHQLNKIGQYVENYRNEREMMRKAHRLGIIYILFNIENNSPSVIPQDFKEELKRVSFADLNSFWKKVHTNPSPGRQYDYKVVMNLRHIEVSPGLIKEREYTDRKTITDGWRYVLDKNGNVLKDSLGNDVKEPNKVEVTATVFQTCQTKSAIVSGELQFFNLRSGNLFHSETITAEAIFENYAATFDGDRRALSEESRKIIGNTPLPFPPDLSLVLDAADQLKPVMKSKIRKGLGRV